MVGKKKKKGVNNFIPPVFFDVLILLLTIIFLSQYFTPELIFSKTTATGGDMGSHYILAKQMSEKFLPSLQFMGWYPGWSGGIPMFQFYFPTPYIFIALLAYILPLEIAFKIGAVVGVFTLPIATFIFLRVSGFPRNTQSIGAIFSLCFLFMESFNNFGGNIKSTLAGQFPNSWSFSLLILFIGLLYRCMDSGKGWRLCAIVFSLLITSHIYTTFIALTAFIFFLPKMMKDLSKVYMVILICGLAFALIAFWSIPFVSNIRYSNASEQEFYPLDISQMILPHPYIPFYLFFLVSMISVIKSIINHKKIEYHVKYLYFGLYSTIMLLLIWSYVIQFNFVRYIPYFYFIQLMIAADGIGRLLKRIKDPQVAIIILFLLTTTYIDPGVDWIFRFTDEVSGRNDLSYISQSKIPSHGLKDIPGWIRWNFEGLERKKEGWDTFSEIASTIKQEKLTGRVQVEYSDYSKMGTARIFEVLPLFSKKPVMENLLFESSQTTAFYFYMQKKISNYTWWPGYPIKYPDFDMAYGMDLMEVYNVQYLVLSSRSSKEAIKELKGPKLIKEIDKFSIYEINQDSSYVKALDRKPILVRTDDYRDIAYQWFDSGDIRAYIAFTTQIDEYDREHFTQIISDSTNRFKSERTMSISDRSIPEALSNSEEYSGKCNVTEWVYEDMLKFTTPCPGRAHLIKIPFFPNWKVIGAERIYQVSPSLMMVFPEEHEVTLYYGSGFPNVLGRTISLFGIIALFLTGTFMKKELKRVIEDIGWSKRVIRLNRSIKQTRHNLEQGIKKIRLSKGLIIRIILIFAVFIVIYTFQYYSKQAGVCGEICDLEGFSDSEYSNFEDEIDQIHFGTEYKRTQEEHSLKSQGGERPDFIYLQGGFVEFQMKINPSKENILELILLKDVQCRTSNIFINGEFVKNITNEKIPRKWSPTNLRIDPKYLSSNSIKVRIEHTDTNCYGWDLMSARIFTPKCSCSKKSVY